MLKKPNVEWPHLARTSYGPGNYAITSVKYRYIHYNDGSEEFYDFKNDPHVWNNQIMNPEYSSKIKFHKAHKPASFHKLLGLRSTCHNAFRATEKLK
jgi:hypothetical protein